MEGRGVDVSDFVRSTKNFGGMGLAGRDMEDVDSSRDRELDASGTRGSVRGPDCAPDWTRFEPNVTLGSLDS
jgi:hypothetical protein